MLPANLDEGFKYIESFTNVDTLQKEKIRVSRLDRMRALLKHFDNPHEGINLIHIAGSKGKGSTATFLAAGIEALGFNTGLYTSPHITSYTERITLAGKPAEDQVYLTLIRLIAQKLPTFKLNEEHGWSKPTTFEILTLLAFLLFKDRNCTWAVIETGIGGRVDATNVITPAASVLTPIELEHTDVLGKTIDKIAREKGGIIKKNTPVFSAPQQSIAADELIKIAQLQQAPIYFIDKEVDLISSMVKESGTEVTLAFKGSQELTSFTISMLGAFQGENSALAYMVLKQVFKPTADDEINILKAFSTVTLAGRMEVVSKDPLVIIDSAHTPLAVKRVKETLAPILDGQGTIIFGSVLGKEPGAMADVLVSMASQIIISRPGTFKESNPEALFALFWSKHDQVYLEPDPAKALKLALSFGAPILVTGSFYMAGEIRAFFVGKGNRTFLTKTSPNIPSQSNSHPCESALRIDNSSIDNTISTPVLGTV